MYKVTRFLTMKALD